MIVFWALAIVGTLAVVPAGFWVNASDSGWSYAAVGVAVITLVLGWAVIGGTTADRISCRNTARNAGVESRWSLSTGCMFRIDGQWVPKSRWIHVTEAKP